MRKTKVFFKGYTFLEILIVLTLITLIVGSVTPNFMVFFSKTHETVFKRLKSVIKILRNDAIIKNNSYCIIFDLKKQSMITTKQNLQGRCFGDHLQEPNILNPYFFEEELILKEARLSENDLTSNLIYTDFLTIKINSSGFVTPFFLKFSSKDLAKYWIIKSVGIMGNLNLIEK